MSVFLPCRAVLFDNDGVLVDSKRAGEEAWIEWAHRYGQDPETVLDGMHGRRSRETVALYVPADEVDEAVAVIDGLELETAHTARAIPGAAELVASLPEPARAVVTSATRPLAAARLAAAGVPVPRVIVSAEQVERGKPAPDPYLAAARQLSIPISECAIFEDSENGIRAARAAGVGALVGVSASALGLGCDVVIADLTHARWTGDGLEIAGELERAGAPDHSA
ncbi:HAD-IA family hydrolase [Gryllotalpicola ginsengisoli]|uniref:HAD-IA family hydrolase n=1 Tax=Gryllotalpicola ginsengisoli TaxID=444608 RepID=UPI0003B3AA3F|nr:HAD-IA family hydrolase [Gryllotalpicola ginsengisoli]